VRILQVYQRNTKTAGEKMSRNAGGIYNSFMLAKKRSFFLFFGPTKRMANSL
jgi:hypothetical protein